MVSLYRKSKVDEVDARVRGHLREGSTAPSTRGTTTIEAILDLAGNGSVSFLPLKIRRHCQRESDLFLECGIMASLKSVENRRRIS